MKHQHLRSFVPALALAVAAAACESTTTRPSVTFVAPQASAPATGSSYKYAQQPITIAITNSAVVTASPATYTIEVSSDSAFATKVFTKDSIAEGAGGTTSVTLSTLDGAKTYYWRSRATVAGTAGEYSAARSFAVGPRVVVDKPVLDTPAAGQVFYSVPTLSTRNATRVGPVTTMQYTFQLSTSSSFASIAQQAVVNENGTSTTSWTPTIELQETTYYWRVRAADQGTGEASGFSDTTSFAKKNGLDTSKVQWTLGANVMNWTETNRLTEAFHEGDRLCMDSEGENWPSAPFPFDPSVAVAGNQINFIQVDGKWYGASGHWYRPNQTCKGEVDDLFFIEGFQGTQPFASFRPYSGMVFGVGLSTPSRAWPSSKTLDHRSNFLLIEW